MDFPTFWGPRSVRKVAIISPEWSINSTNFTWVGGVNKAIRPRFVKAQKQVQLLPWWFQFGRQFFAKRRHLPNGWRFRRRMATQRWAVRSKTWLHKFPLQDESTNDIPICSMYGIVTYIYHKFRWNVGKFTIHGTSGTWLLHLMNNAYTGLNLWPQTKLDPGWVHLVIIAWVM